ncbi:hypothetical protein ABZ508_26645 [Streptomyces lavendulocolor]|uniref:Uncharacterized protein n=1 Tax=Streptomyces lavendulocolor TaxID=67316 RepID=A0ABV2WC83_9ACTN
MSATVPAPAGATSTLPSPSRRLVAAGIKRGAGALVTTTVMSAADRAAHEAASYVRAPRNLS